YLALALLLLAVGALAACERRAPAPPRPTTQMTGQAAALVGDQAAGARLWTEKQCLGCHGGTALGGIGRSLAGTALPFERFLAQIRNALPPKPAMSAADLSDEEAYSLYLWLQTISPAPAKPAAATPAPLPKGQVLGIQLWTERGCAQCHGAFAQGSDKAPALARDTYPFERQRAVMRQTAVLNTAHGVDNINDEVLARLLDWLRRGADPASGC
ncbi:MAG: c-type cytochrome, partial [Chloroflexota bacterium]